MISLRFKMSLRFKFFSMALDYKSNVILKLFPNNDNHQVNVFYQKDDDITYNDGNENERLTSLGARYFGTYESGSYNNELMYEFGDFGNQKINAFTVSFQLKKKMKLSNHIFNTCLKTEIICGDKDANDNTLNIFDALYPRGAYFERVSRFGLQT